ncbi:MAG TPA: hypothetical protein VF121_14720 [Thermoanaerobaculia bacterium]|nr:hypothetical protein [Thermoanaerobaculia bacterium]
MQPDLKTVVAVMAGVAVLALCVAFVLLVYVYRRLQRLDVPEGAGFFATLRLVPLALVVALDLLDLALDVFATPIVWVVLRRFRLHALRDVATFEALIPFTGPIPTLTLAWFAARWLDLGDRPARPAPAPRPALPRPKRP